MRRKPTIEPKQTKISVQDVRDVTTPQGVAMLNDELKRIQLSIEQQTKEVKEKKLIPSVKVETPKKTSELNKKEKNKEWALTVRDNTILVSPGKVIQSLNFLDSSTIKFTVKNVNIPISDKTIDNARMINITAKQINEYQYDDCLINVDDDIFNYEEDVAKKITNKSLSYEYIEHSDYIVSSGVETIPTIQEISNRQPQYNNAITYPKTNNGDGWIPLKAETKVFGYLDEVKGEPFVYEDPAVGTQSRTAFVFTATESGIYRIKASVYLRIIPTWGLITAAPMPYDSIDKGMLIIERAKEGELIINPRNPLSDYTNPLDYIYTIMDMKCRIGNQNSTRNLGQYNSDQDNGGAASRDYMLPATTYPNRYYIDGGAVGLPYGEMFNREILLNGTTDLYLEIGDSIMLWYKIYTRRLKFDTPNYFSDSYASRTGVNSGSYSSDSICFVEDRAENISIMYLREGYVIRDKSSVKNIVKSF